MKNNIDKQYQELLYHILHFGVDKKDRTGTGTKSLFGWQIRHNMKDGFPLLTTKKMAWKQIVTELLWFLRGDTNIKYLVENDCHIWDGDAYKAYRNYLSKNTTETRWQKILSSTPNSMTGRAFEKDEFIEEIKNNPEFAKKWGELGPIYGKQWRKWTKKKMYLSSDGSYEKIYDEVDQTVVDQIQILINELKTNPDSRRLMVSAWNVGELDQMVLPPCHFSWQCYSHEKDGKRYLSLAWNQRSVDVGLGLPFNIASYALLLEIIAKEVDMIPYEVIGNLGDCHIYNNHIEGLKEQLTRIPYKLPKLIINDEFWNHEHQTIDGWISSMEIDDFNLENYQSHPSIKLPLSN
jgi:thymidylate synthase